MKNNMVKGFGIFFLIAGLLATFSIPAMCAERPIVLKMAAQNFPPENTFRKSCEYFADLVKQKTNGNIEIKLYFDTIARGPEAFSACQYGIADLVQIVTAFVSSRVKDFVPFDLYGAYPTDKFPEVAEKIHPVLTKILDEQDLVHLANMFSGSSLVFASREQNFTSMKDFKGKKIRSVGKWANKGISVLGATPTQILPPELYTSVQKGIVDAAASIPELVALLKLYEVAPFLTEYKNISTSMQIVSMNKKKFNSLDPKYQEVLLQAANEMALYSFQYGMEKEKELLSKMRTTCTLVELTPKEYPEVMEAWRTIYPEARKGMGPLGNQLLDMLDEISTAK